jgi:hypothetical protein
MSSTLLDNWLKKVIPVDTGLTHFQSQFRVTVYKTMGHPTHDSIKREEDLVKVTNRSEHDRTIDVQSVSAQDFVGTHTTPSTTHDDDDSVVQDSDESHEEHSGVCDPNFDNTYFLY